MGECFIAGSYLASIFSTAIIVGPFLLVFALLAIGADLNMKRRAAKRRPMATKDEEYQEASRRG
jgi:hypothetical protein